MNRNYETLQNKIGKNGLKRNLFLRAVCFEGKRGRLSVENFFPSFDKFSKK